MKWELSKLLDCYRFLILKKGEKSSSLPHFTADSAVISTRFWINLFSSRKWTSRLTQILSHYYFKALEWLQHDSPLSKTIHQSAWTSPWIICHKWIINLIICPEDRTNLSGLRIISRLNITLVANLIHYIADLQFSGKLVHLGCPVCLEFDGLLCVNCCIVVTLMQQENIPQNCKIDQIPQIPQHTSNPWLGSPLFTALIINSALMQPQYRSETAWHVFL